MLACSGSMRLAAAAATSAPGCPASGRSPCAGRPGSVTSRSSIRPSSSRRRWRRRSLRRLRGRSCEVVLERVRQLDPRVGRGLPRAHAQPGVAQRRSNRGARPAGRPAAARATRRARARISARPQRADCLACRRHRPARPSSSTAGARAPPARGTARAARATSGASPTRRSPSRTVTIHGSRAARPVRPPGARPPGRGERRRLGVRAEQLRPIRAAAARAGRDGPRCAA